MQVVLLLAVARGETFLIIKKARGGIPRSRGRGRASLVRRVRTGLLPLAGRSRGIVQQQYSRIGPGHRRFPLLANGRDSSLGDLATADYACQCTYQSQTDDSHNVRLEPQARPVNAQEDCQCCERI